MILRRDDSLRGVDDFVAEIALAKRARQRCLAGTIQPPCRRRFTHPRRPTQFDHRGFLVVDTCECVLLADHDDGCVCEHNVERLVYHVDGREHYATRPVAHLLLQSSLARLGIGCSLAPERSAKVNGRGCSEHRARRSRSRSARPHRFGRTAVLRTSSAALRSLRNP